MTIRDLDPAIKFVKIKKRLYMIFDEGRFSVQLNKDNVEKIAMICDIFLQEVNNDKQDNFEIKAEGVKG